MYVSNAINCTDSDLEQSSVDTGGTYRGCISNMYSLFGETHIVSVDQLINNVFSKLIITQGTENKAGGNISFTSSLTLAILLVHLRFSRLL